MNVDVSPDGETLIFDLLGDIYRLPYAGGVAVPLTTGRGWDQAPRFSPDGAQVYFVSDRDGAKNIWRLVLSDRSLQQVTRSDSDIMGGPNWSQDGNHLLAGLGIADPRNSEVILHSIEPDTGSMEPIDPPSGPWIDLDTFKYLRPAAKIYSGVESADDQVFFSAAQFGQGGRTVRMYRFNLHTQKRTAITPLDATRFDYKPQLSHDGKLLAYFRQYNDRRTEIRILNRTTGQDEALVELANADDALYSVREDSRPNYAFTPDDRQLVYWHDGKIHRTNLADRSSEIIPFRAKVEREVWTRAMPTLQHFSDIREASAIRWPSITHDGQTLAFTATGYVWVMDLQTGVVRRLTDSSDFEYMPAISPDGNSIAYVSFVPSEDEYWPGRLMVANVDDGARRELLAVPNGTYLLPNWSSDGSMIAVIQEVEGEKGVEATFGWTSATSGAFHEVASEPKPSALANLYIYARSVDFDEAGRKLLFSFPRTRNETVLASASLDGGAQSILAVGTSEIGGISPAPDLNNLALTRHDGTVWVVPFNPSIEQNQVSTLAPDARRVSPGAGYYVNWNGPDQITFGFAQYLYRYNLDRGDPESLRVKLPFETPKATRRPIAFTKARLITMSGDTGAGPVIESGTLVLSGRRIAAIGAMDNVVIPSNALVIDATGKTIMPGFLDTHYHRIGGRSLSAFALPNARFSDESAIGYGVTSAWEPGAAPNDGVPAMVDLQEAGRISGPRWSHSAGARVGYPWKQLTDYAAALAAVEHHQALGVDVLKEYNTPTREQRQWLSAAAHENGMGIVSHIESFDGMMTRIIDGYTGGDHPYIPIPFFMDVRELLKQTGYMWTPSIVITSGIVGSGGNSNSCYWKLVLGKRPRELEKRDALTSSYPFKKPHATQPCLPSSVHRIRRVARQAASAASDGVRIGVSAHGMPGSTLHREIWLLWKGGMPVEQVLRAATIGNAEKLGLQEEIGSLEPGKIADFLVLDANPLDDILNTLSLKYTVQGGVVYDSDTALPADLSGMQRPMLPQSSGQRGL